MTAGPRRAVILLAAALIAAAAVAFAVQTHRHAAIASRPEAQRPPLLLLTSLPLLFGEQFSLEGGSSPAFKALETRYRVVPISVTDENDLAKGWLLLMAHPLAQPAEDLVALDEWVRRGGRVLLLADPLLEWPSSRPLGDPLRPPPMFMDTGLLAHWGLRLDAPERRGPQPRKLGGYDVLAVSPGRLSGSCEISPDAIAAYCTIGKGRATVVADADFLNSEGNFDGLLAELARLEAK
jgi:hypothetical protein